MTPHEDENPELTVLREEIHRLALRVDALEHHTVYHAEAAAPAYVGTPEFAMPDAIPVLGKAVLALAGAYVLRALAEASPVPSPIVVALAILYAIGWLASAQWSARRSALGGATYSLTAALILSPMLWEGTARFHVLPSLVTAAVPVVFAAIGSGAAITTISSILTALALMIGTGDLVPFALALLAIAAMAQTHGRIRVPAMVAAALGVCVVVFIVTRPAGVPEDYRPVGPAMSMALCWLLFTISAAGIGWRAVWRRGLLTVFEIVQAVVSFLLAAGGSLQDHPGTGRSGASGHFARWPALPAIFTAFMSFPQSPRRNHHVFAAWGAVLGILACWLILSDWWLTPIWSAAAVVATVTRRRTLAIHGELFLLAAGIASGMPQASMNAFAGVSLHSPTSAMWFFTLAATACYALSYRTQLGIVSALVAAPSLAALVIMVVRLPLALLLTARTLIICALALGYALTGFRTGRREMFWIAYAAIALGSVKLLGVDFRQSHPAALAVSLLCYGGLLLLMPRLSARPKSPHENN